MEPENKIREFVISFFSISKFQISEKSGVYTVLVPEINQNYFQKSKLVFTFDEKVIGISRNIFCDALKAEGIPIFAGYVEPLHLNPIYTEKRAYAFKHYTGNVEYGKGVCPVAEKLHETDLINTIFVDLLQH